MNAAGYESWFVSARAPAARRALWIRHTTYQPRQGPGSAALWCTVLDHDLASRPIVVKQVFAVHPAEALASPARFRGNASMGPRTARWDLGIAAALRPLRPELLYRAPLPRAKLEASVPDALISGTLEIDGRGVEVAGWRGTVGHNWGSGHGDSWAWVHADSFEATPDGWLELVLARIRVGGLRSPWTAMGALGVAGQRIALGGLGRRPRAEVLPYSLAARIPGPGAWLQLNVTSADDDAIAAAYSDPAGGARSVRHAAIATVKLTLHRRGQSAITLTSQHGVYESGVTGPQPGMELEALPQD
jgi:hypothetical protein